METQCLVRLLRLELECRHYAASAVREYTRLAGLFLDDHPNGVDALTRPLTGWMPFWLSCWSGRNVGVQEGQGLRDRSADDTFRHSWLRSACGLLGAPSLGGQVCTSTGTPTEPPNTLKRWPLATTDPAAKADI